jgi:radical SAM protein with 4Fe4S-binding SPASM domain
MICWLTLNRACNLRCKWCYAMAENFDSATTMTLNVFEKILSVISSTHISEFILIGGEPTLHSDLPLFIKKLKPAKVLLVTNAIKLANIDYLKQLKDNGLDKVTVSLKGATDEEYLMNTGVSAIQRVEEAVANLNSLDISYTISVTFSSSIMNTIPSILKWMKSSNAKIMSVNYCRPVILNEAVSIDEVPHPQNMANKTIESYQLIKDSGVRCVYNFLLPLCLLPRELINELIKDDQLTTICQLQKRNGLIFTQDGSLVPCNHLYDYSLGKLDIDFKTPEEFELFSQREEIIEFYQKAHNLPDIKCKQCSLKTYCGGGCFIQYLYYDPSKIIIEPFN